MMSIPLCDYIFGNVMYRTFKTIVVLMIITLWVFGKIGVVGRFSDCMPFFL